MKIIKIIIKTLFNYAKVLIELRFMYEFDTFFIKYMV